MNKSKQNDAYPILQWRGYEDLEIGKKEDLFSDKFKFQEGPSYPQNSDYFYNRMNPKQYVQKMIKVMLEQYSKQQLAINISICSLKQKQSQLSFHSDRAERTRKRNPLRNFFQDSRPIILKLLRKQVPGQFESNKNIQSLINSHSGSKKIYLAVLLDHRLKQAFHRIFEGQLLQKQYDKSRHSEEIKQAYKNNACVFQQAFIKQRFDRIAFQHIQQSQSDQPYSTTSQSQQSQKGK